MMHGIMDRVGCPPVYWLLCLLYVIGLLNILSNSKGCIPLTVVTGQITDISLYLDFDFWQEVFVEVPGGGEQLARWCGPSHKQGDFVKHWRKHLNIIKPITMSPCINIFGPISLQPMYVV